MVKFCVHISPVFSCQVTNIVCVAMWSWVTYSDWWVYIKMWLHYLLLWNLDSYKIFLCFIVLSATVCTVGYICLFRGGQFFVDFVSFLSLIIYEVLYTRCLRYNICSAWFLDIRISTCLQYSWFVNLKPSKLVLTITCYWLIC